MDRIGLPIYTAIRPTAEDGAVSIYGGKGITKEHAKASAMMEGFERYSAEKQTDDEVVVATIDEISDFGEYIDPKSLNLPKEFEKKTLDDFTLEWSSFQRHNLSDEDYYIPTNAIFHPYLHEIMSKAYSNQIPMVLHQETF